MDDRGIWILTLAGKKMLYLIKTAHMNPRSYSASTCSQHLTEDVSPEVKQPGQNITPIEHDYGAMGEL